MSLSLCRAVVGAGLFLSVLQTSVVAQVSLGIGSTAQREAETRILRQLESRGSFNFESVPLNAFVAQLAERFGINVVIDVRALDDYGIDVTTPVSMRLRDATLESCLNLTLAPLELTWTIRHESLIITTAEDAELRLATRVYPVRDLVLIELEHTVHADFDGLIATITSTVQPDSWGEVGGPGAIEPQWGALALVISQTWQAHRQIEPLLATLRTAREAQGIQPLTAGTIPTTVPKPQRQYRATAAAAWQWPRVYDE